MLLNKKEVSDKEFFKRIKPIDKNFKYYMINFILPEAVAFYLKDCYYKECLCEAPFYNHVNATLETINNSYNSIDKLMPIIEKILFVKYNLIIINYDPLEFIIRNN